MKYKNPQSITKSNLSMLSFSAYPSITSTLFAATIICNSYSIELFSFNAKGSVEMKFALNLFL